MLNQYEKLKEILREMFQMDQSDLDFGIYRIMNAKRDEIESFLDKELLPQVKQEFAKYRGTEIEEKKKELSALEATLRDSGMNPDDAPKVKALREEIAKYGDDETLANEVFSHLSSFFRRYYDNGDFLSLRRYKKDTYAIPYEGEEVKLHWANADQYYIKTSEFLRDYAFKLSDGKRAHFKLVDATQEKDNIKTEAGKERKFKLHAEEPFRIEGSELYIQFVYLGEKEKQDVLNKKTMETLSAEFGKKLKDFDDVFAPVPTAKNPKRTLLEKHLYSYTARFNFDFFIHKDLGGFLRRELDFYIKNEVLFVDDLDVQDEKKLKSAVAKVKVIKHIAQKIVAFLAQLEDFQKKLWLKKKFVVACGYCVTLDRVPHTLYDEIIKNDAQQEEWVKLFAIDEILSDLTRLGYSKPLTMEFLKANPYLLLDTKYFDEPFKEKLLASFENLDEACDGFIINSENLQALNLLLEKYREQIKCVYIDPPYNTNASEIVYKNGYKHASWLSLLYDRLVMGREMLSQKGVFQVAIDDEEFHRLECIIRQAFGDDNYIANIAIMHNPKGRDQEHVATAHEYTILAAKNIREASTFRLKLSDKQAEQKYSKTDGDEKYRELSLRRSGSGAKREDRPYMYFPFLYQKQTKKLSVVSEDEYKEIFNRKQFNDGYVKSLKEKYEKEGIVFILPIREDGSLGRWRWGYESSKNGCEDGSLFVKMGDNPTVYQKDFADNTFLPKTFWYGERYDASTKGTNLLKDIMGPNPFDYPKSIFAVEDMITIASQENDVVVDFFGGSGTTAHAVINLNRESEESLRKYILIEMGDHFHTVLKPRIQRVVYSKDWKDGKPVSREGISHMFKYMRLEGYDDALDNLEAIRTDGQQKTLEKMSPQAREDYMLSYLLDIETRTSDSLLNVDRFVDPFNYTLKIRRDNELKDQKIDLVETFNYLIGLYVEQVETVHGFKVVRGKLRTGEKTLVIWRNTKDKSNEALDEFFKKQKYNTLDFEFDLIFVNGDNNLENLKVAEDKWKVRMIEEEFKKRMFEQAEV